jgi:hypothetical protein
MSRDTSPTQNYDFPRPKKGASWAADWDTLVETIDEQLFETDKIKVYEDSNGTVVLEDTVNGNQIELDDDVTMADVASHLAAGDNPHTTTLEQARAEDNQLSGPVSVGDDIATTGGTTVWDSATGAVPQAQLGGPASSLSGYPLSVAMDTEASAYPLANADLANSSVTVAGNNVSLGGSTGVAYTALSDTAASFPIPIGDLASPFALPDITDMDVDGASLTDAETTLYDASAGEFVKSELGGPASSLTSYPLPIGDLDSPFAPDDIASVEGYPFANSDLANSRVAVNAGSGLTTTNVTIGLGGGATVDVEPADFAGALLFDDGADNLQVDESSIDHDNIDQSTVDADDHHDEDHAARHGAGGDDELATALRYEPESEPSTPDAGVVRWYDSGTDAFKAKFDDGSTVTLAEQ